MNGTDTIDIYFGSCFYYSHYGVACCNVNQTTQAEIMSWICLLPQATYREYGRSSRLGLIGMWFRVPPYSLSFARVAQLEEQ